MSVRPARQGVELVDKPLTKHSSQVPKINLSTYAYLLGELVRYSQGLSSSISELEHRIRDVGEEVGLRVLELMSWREQRIGSKRHLRFLDALKYIYSQVWPYLFGKQADDLQMSDSVPGQYMIIDKDLQTSRYISLPRDYKDFNAGYFVAGIVQGYLKHAGFPSTVEAHAPSDGSVDRTYTVIVVQFDDSVLKREEHLNNG